MRSRRYVPEKPIPIDSFKHEASVVAPRPSERCSLKTVLVVGLFLLIPGALWLRIATLKPTGPPNAMRAYVESLLEHESNDADACYELAVAQREPYSDKYKNQEIDVDGPVYAYHAWEGVVEKAEMEKRQIDLQKNNTLRDCRLVYKIFEGELYAYVHNYCYEEGVMGKRLVNDRFNLTTDLILLAMEVYGIPDMDFAVTLGDREELHEGQGTPLPSMSYCVRYLTQNARGFAIPCYNTYRTAMGEHQMSIYSECLQQKFPRESRIRKAVWRGDTTGPLLRQPGDLMKNPRVALSFLGAHMPDLLDTGLTQYVQMNKTDAAMKDLLNAYAPLVPPIRFELFNTYGAIIDVDGNTWSEHLPSLLRTNTPILRQRYKYWMDYFGHLMQDDIHVKFFESDLSDLIPTAADLLDEEVFTPEQFEQRVAHQTAFARDHCSQLGVIRAMAYALVKMRSYMKWEVEMEDGYEKIPTASCCYGNPALPPELVAKIRSGS